MTGFTTLQSCPSCSSPMVLHVLPTCHDRPGVSFLRCVDCGAEDGHRIDPTEASLACSADHGPKPPPPATPSIASPGRFTEDPWWQRQGGPASVVHAGTRR